jgi:putative glutamine amidotransferase
MNRPAPVVLVPACQRVLGRHPFHVAGKKYLDAIRLAGCVPLIVPGASPLELDTLLSIADGLLLTGSPSNVHPSHFGEDVHDPSLPLDPVRDEWTLPIIRQALARGMPVLGICRGFQEVNVAVGGSLHQAVHEQPGFINHRADDRLPVDEEYGPAHPVAIEPGGLLSQLLEGVPSVRDGRFMVNSLHGQGANRLGPGVRVEARAPDGVVEAITWSPPEGGPAGFNLCLQWHPEWKAADNPVSLRLFTAFGHACQIYRDQRVAGVAHTQPPPTPRFTS